MGWRGQKETVPARIVLAILVYGPTRFVMRLSPRTQEPRRVRSCPTRQLLQPSGTPCDLARHGDTNEEEEVEEDTKSSTFEAKAAGSNKKAPKWETLLQGYVTIMAQLQEHVETTANQNEPLLRLAQQNEVRTGIWEKQIE